MQLSNSALAIAALQILQQLGWDISAEAIATGMAKLAGLGGSSGQLAKSAVID